MRYIELLASYLPSIIVEDLLTKGDEAVKIPRRLNCETAVLFADVSGFTRLSEAMTNRHGAHLGCEYLAKHLNSYFAQIVKIIGSEGGDVLKFAGDAMIVLWPPSDDEDLVNRTRRACQCAIRVQQLGQELKFDDNVTLSIKIGIGVGEMAILNVGGVLERTEYVAVGEPMIQAFEAEHNAQPGDVILSPNSWDLVKTYFKGEKVNSPDVSYERYYKLDTKENNGKEVLRKRNKHFGAATRFDSYTTAHEQKMRNLIPGAALQSIDSNHLEFENYTSELRRVSVLFVSLGFTEFDLVEAASQDREMLRIHYALRIAQEAVYKFEGALNKFLMDDKGATLICVFGLPPYSHENDPTRAVSCALAMTETLKLELDLDSSVGVTTGSAFCGVLGSQTRKEYSVLGDSINLSARLMQASKKAGPCIVYVDDSTYQASHSDVPLRVVGRISVKGKKYPIQTYQAVGRLSKEKIPMERMLQSAGSLFNLSKVNNRGRRNSPAAYSQRYSLIDLIITERAINLEEDTLAKNENLRLYFRKPSKVVTNSSTPIKKNTKAASAGTRLSKRLTAIFTRGSHSGSGEEFSYNLDEIDDASSVVSSVSSDLQLPRRSTIKRDSFVFYNNGNLDGGGPSLESLEQNRNELANHLNDVYMQVAVGVSGLYKIGELEREGVKDSQELLQMVLKAAKQTNLLQQNIAPTDVELMFQGTEIALPSGIATSNRDKKAKRVGIPMHYVESIVTEALGFGEIRKPTNPNMNSKKGSQHGSHPASNEYIDETGNGGTTLKLVLVPKKDLPYIQATSASVMQTLMIRKLELIEHNKGSITMISGDPGVGKSHILKRFAFGFLPGTVPLFGSVEKWQDNDTANQPFAVWYDIINQWIDLIQQQQKEKRKREDLIKNLLPPDMFKDVWALNQGLATVFETPKKKSSSGEAVEVIVMALIVEIIAEIAKRYDGLLIIFDDGLRIDEYSFRVATRLSQLIGNDEIPLMLVFSTRPFEPLIDRSMGLCPNILPLQTREALGAYRRLCAQPLVEVLRLGRLSHYHAYEFFRRMVGDNVQVVSDELWNICESRCYNNPLLIREFAFALRSSRRPKIVKYIPLKQKKRKDANAAFIATLNVPIQEMDESAWKVHADYTVASSKQAAYVASHKNQHGISDDDPDASSKMRFPLDHFPPAELPPPATATGVLGAQIDRLPPLEQLVLKIASVIGSIFSLRLVEDVYPYQDDSVDREMLRVACENLADEHGLLHKIRAHAYNDEYVYQFSSVLLLATVRHRLLEKQKISLSAKASRSRGALRTMLDYDEGGDISSANASKSGYLCIKKADKRLLASEFKERFVELNNDSILIFKKEQDSRKSPHEIIRLAQASLEFNKDEDPKTFIVETSDWQRKGENKNSAKTFAFLAATEEEAEVWANHVRMLINKTKLKQLLPSRFGTNSTRFLKQSGLLPLRKRNLNLENCIKKDENALIITLESAKPYNQPRIRHGNPIPEIYASLRLRIKDGLQLVRKQTTLCLPQSMQLLTFDESFVFALQPELLYERNAVLEVVLWRQKHNALGFDEMIGHCSINIDKLFKQSKKTKLIKEECEILNPYNRTGSVMSGTLDVKVKLQLSKRATLTKEPKQPADLETIAAQIYNDNKQFVLRTTSVNL